MLRYPYFWRVSNDLRKKDIWVLPDADEINLDINGEGVLEAFADLFVGSRGIDGPGKGNLLVIIGR